MESPSKQLKIYFFVGKVIESGNVITFFNIRQVLYKRPLVACHLISFPPGTLTPAQWIGTPVHQWNSTG
jgi:hypothetical protein